MCGIAGLFGQKNNNSFEKSVETMILSLSHRGPDDSGVWKDNKSQIVFGHRRLSILDLTKAGHQPMTSFCGRYVNHYNKRHGPATRHNREYLTYITEILSIRVSIQCYQ